MSYQLYDFGRTVTGFFRFRVKAEKGTELSILFDEVIAEKEDSREISPFRNSCCNVIQYTLAEGESRILTFEANSARFAAVVIRGGGAEISDFGMVLYENPDAGDYRISTGDEALDRITKAAANTFAQNAVDVLTDCPSRERAGWLCDSFFTARTEYALTGESRVERAFLENFLMPASFPLLPEGMLPKAYPAIDRHGTFIPNWAMWYVLELEEYRFARGGDPALVEAARKRMYGLLGYFRRFENEDGLLQRLESWIFLEWSHANQLTQDINYPTNMLYVRFKRALAALYGDGALREEADRLAEVIRARSFTGEWFCDNAVLRDGKAVLSGECTEVCQYYAFFTGVADPVRYPALWETLVRDFGPKRAETGAYPEIWPANPFIGYYLRLELLFRAGAYDEVLENIRGYFSAMAETTGTLWEGTDDRSSCNHGFASHAAVWLRAIAEANEKKRGEKA
jgi:alpha-L-rhamnosidase